LEKDVKILSRNVTGDWVWSSDEEDNDDDPDKNKSKKMSKTPKEV
jgi:hypothetical protein